MLRHRAAISCVGTFRTQRDVRVASAMQKQNGHFGRSMKTPASAAPRAGINVLDLTP
jgi:hypothetical protein